jgi:Fur family zinc uptake transcriptional regulator
MRQALTKNQVLVLDKLTAASKPQTAYSLLEQLREHGLKAPPQIYRALEKLLALGLIHKLESINSFVACQHSDCAHQIAGFAICDGCDQVSEIIDDNLESQIRSVAKTVGLVPKKSTMEIHGLCSSCKGSEAG